MSVKRVWLGDEGYAPDLNRTLAPGDEVEFDVDPESPLWVTAAEAKRLASQRPSKSPVLDPNPDDQPKEK